MEKNFARARKTSYLSYGRIYSSNRKKNMSFAFYLHVQQKIWCKIHEKKNSHVMDYSFKMLGVYQMYMVGFFLHISMRFSVCFYNGYSKS